MKALRMGERYKSVVEMSIRLRKGYFGPNPRKRQISLIGRTKLHVCVQLTAVKPQRLQHHMVEPGAPGRIRRLRPNFNTNGSPISGPEEKIVVHDGCFLAGLKVFFQLD